MTGGLNLNLVADPLIAPALLAALALGALAFIALALFLRAPGTLFRASALTVLLAVLLNPTVQQEDRESIDDVAVVLVDKSPSMELGARAASRERALSDLTEELERLPALDVRIVESERAARDGGTALFGALDETIADIPRERLAGILVLSDGQVHDTPVTLAALGIDAPLHALIVGDRNAPDRKLVVEEAPRFGIVGEPVTVRFHVEEEGTGSAGKVRVRIERDGTLLREMRVTPGTSVETELTLPHGGESIVELIAETGPGELTEQNNRATLVMTGVRDRLRVLLVSGEPHAGERTWRNLLKADPSVDLVHFTILRPPEKQDGTPISELSLIAFPTRELFSVKLDEFDLIIFDRYRRRGVLPVVYLGNVARYVENGGAVLAAAGPAFASPFSIYRTPLAGILPAQPTGQIVEQGFRPEITEDGRRHPVTAGLPGGDASPPDWGRWFRLIDATPTHGRVVMQGPEEKPLMILDTIGQGRVAQLLSDHAWLWTRGYDGGGPQAELLRRLAHWLMKEPDLEEERLLATGEGGMLTIERHTMEETTSPVTVTLPSGIEQTLDLTETAPGRFVGRMETEELGLHMVTDGTLRTVAAVGPANPREFKDVRPSADLLEPLVAETGGGTYWLDEMDAPPSLRGVRPGRDAAGGNWAGLRQNGEYILKAVSQTPLLSPLIALPVLLGLLLLGWRREGR